MATKHLTDLEAQKLTLPDLIRRAACGEAIHIETSSGPVLICQSPPPRMDPSVEATLARLRRSEEERGEPLRMGADYADDMEKIIAMRTPGRGDPWSW